MRMFRDLGGLGQRSLSPSFSECLCHASLHWRSQNYFMGKFKPAGSKKAPAKSARSAIPCLVLIILGIGGMCLLFYFALQSGNIMRIDKRLPNQMRPVRITTDYLMTAEGSALIE